MLTDLLEIANIYRRPHLVHNLKSSAYSERRIVHNCLYFQSDGTLFYPDLLNFLQLFNERFKEHRNSCQFILLNQSVSSSASYSFLYLLGFFVCPIFGQVLCLPQIIANRSEENKFKTCFFGFRSGIKSEPGFPSI